MQQSRGPKPPKPPLPARSSARWEEEPITTVYPTPAAPRAPVVSAPWVDVEPEDLVPTVRPPPPVAAAPTAPLPAPPPAPRAPQLTSRPPAAHIPSTGPLAIDLSAHRASAPVIPVDTGPVEWPPGLRRRRSAQVLVGVLVGALAVALGVTQWARIPRGTPPAAAPAEPIAGPVFQPPPEPSPAVPASPPATASTPTAAPTTGTVIGAPYHRLYIDGRAVTGESSKVKCGKHTVRSGSRGTERTVDVPCGGEITVAP